MIRIHFEIIRRKVQLSVFLPSHFYQSQGNPQRKIEQAGSKTDNENGRGGAPDRNNTGKNEKADAYIDDSGQHQEKTPEITKEYIFYKLRGDPPCYSDCILSKCG